VNNGDTAKKKRGVEEKTLLYYSSKVVFKLLYSHIDLSPFFSLKSGAGEKDGS